MSPVTVVSGAAVHQLPSVVGQPKQYMANGPVSTKMTNGTHVELKKDVADAVQGVVSLSSASQKIASLMASASQGQFPVRNSGPLPAATLVRSFVTASGPNQAGGDASGSMGGVALATGQPVTLVTAGGQGAGVQLIQPVSLGQAVLSQRVPMQSAQHAQMMQSEQSGPTESGDVKNQAQLLAAVMGGATKRTLENEEEMRADIKRMKEEGAGDVKRENAE
nr:hypothetical protein BaRGS_000153 [Batillaria attramentaria]